MRILSLRVTNGSGDTHDDVVSHMPALPAGVLWSNFYDSVDGSALEAGFRFALLLLEGSPESDPYRGARDQVRQALAQLSVTVEYEDLYQQRMPAHKESLSWFGRHHA